MINGASPAAVIPLHPVSAWLSLLTAHGKMGKEVEHGLSSIEPKDLWLWIVSSIARIKMSNLRAEINMFTASSHVYFSCKVGHFAMGVYGGLTRF